MSELSDVAKALGKKGGESTKRKYGKEHYQKLAAHMNKVRAEKKSKKGTQPLKKNSLDMPFE